MQRIVLTGVALALLCLSPAVLANGPIADLAAPAGSTAASCSLGPDLPSRVSADLLFYALPLDALSHETNHVRTQVTVNGETFLSEGFSIHRETVTAQSETLESGFAVFELFADHLEQRAMLAELYKRADAIAEITIEVNDTPLLSYSLDELYAASQEVVATNVLPTAVQTHAQLHSGVQRFGVPHKFEVCGDGICAPGSFPFGEDCETCPEDCGGPCNICGNGICGSGEDCNNCTADCGTCCPWDLPNQTRTELVSVSNLGLSCYRDIFGIGFDYKYYTRYRYKYKTYTVSRVRECNGSITETVVPGSTSYFYANCYHRTSQSCRFGSPFWPTPIC